MHDYQEQRYGNETICMHDYQEQRYGNDAQLYGALSCQAMEYIKSAITHAGYSDYKKAIVTVYCIL